ncbi:molybdopterin-dependent oxidoreductase [Promethearchaeum syntrophicum]|uniref:Molybdopterin-dependent oxidoreductase n=1 Tax=Promethearchaeum syntrophicum TaxID=2594042 RepID=A0A5B9D847_9ARCH|nr:molybdopterin-dependent oxidoreductase [Candidatus Prometheoarchaeum syntrophicum]
MKKVNKRFLIYIFIFTIFIVGIIFGNIFLDPEDNSNSYNEVFPDFITKNEDYFITRIGNAPIINSDTYSLNVWGQIDNPKNFSLMELQELNLIEQTLTTETIGNPTNGQLVSTAVWKGFLIYDFIVSLGLKENVTGIKYVAEDGYYVSHTLSQLLDNGIIGALYMNDESLPVEQGFPLRIVSPGAYGAKQPAWVISIEVIDRPLEDYWDDRGWDTSPPMDVDSTLFFPRNSVNIKVGEPLKIGGAAYGGTKISMIEYTIDLGLNWRQGNIIQSIDVDHVWVFWEINVTFDEIGTFTLYTKATDIYNNTQPMDDPVWQDGSNGWPKLTIKVIS